MGRRLRQCLISLSVTILLLYKVRPDLEVLKGVSSIEPHLVCSLWETDMDDWWQVHPDWEPHAENLTHTCFRPIPHEAPAAMLRRIYHNQFLGNCEKVMTRNIVPHGYGSSIGWLGVGFWTALQQHRPFQANKHWEGFRWIYAPPYNLNEVPQGLNRSWAACPRQDHTCYFLPISNCTVDDVRSTDVYNGRITKKMNSVTREEYAWLLSYLTRPHQKVRQRMVQLMRDEAPHLPPGNSCTWIHVRRGDALTENNQPGKSRRFHGESKSNS
jgi:hypothetical protein